MKWYEALFGKRSAPKAAAQPSAEPVSPSGGNGGGSAEEIYAHAPEKAVRSSQQHVWLFDEGVEHWNSRRRADPFKANLSGLNFVKEAGKSRLFGRPADIIGEERVTLAGIDWHEADLQGCTLTKADLRGANLRGANLRNANLAGALLNGADLTDADLRGANLDGAQLARAKLGHTNLSGASLRHANFAWTDMTHTLVGAKNLREASTFGVVYAGMPKFQRREYPQPFGWPMPYQQPAAGQQQPLQLPPGGAQIV